MTELVWSGEKGRKLQACRPCPCGCAERDGKKVVGYLTGSDGDGNGFSIWIESEAVFKRLKKMLDEA